MVEVVMRQVGVGVGVRKRLLKHYDEIFRHTFAASLICNANTLSIPKMAHSLSQETEIQIGHTICTTQHLVTRQVHPALHFTDCICDAMRYTVLIDHADLVVGAADVFTRGCKRFKS